MIKVGGATEIEVKEKKDRVEDALNATRAAVEEGIVPGGGVALLRAKKAVGRIHDENPDVQAGINIVLKALEAPIRQIAENAGVEGSIVVGKIMDEKSETYGFDAQDEKYVDMIEAGIVDPAKVVRTALQDAGSVAGLLVTTEAMVAELPKEPAPAHAGRRRHGRNGRHDVKPARYTGHRTIKGPGSRPGLFVAWHQLTLGRNFKVRRPGQHHRAALRAASRSPAPARRASSWSACMRSSCTGRRLMYCGSASGNGPGSMRIALSVTVHAAAHGLAPQADGGGAVRRHRAGSARA